MQGTANDKRRLEAIDFARGAALVAMAIYHFAWDLEFFGYAPPGMTAEGGWKLFARGIASSFLFLVGVSLYLAHANGIRWASFRRRFIMVAGAAAAISLITWFAVPGAFIFFGILHQIALASLLGLAFLRWPAWATVLAALAVIAAPHFLRSTLFDHPAFWWLGLSSVNPRSNDYVPLFPWFAAVLLGIAAAGLATRAGLFARLRALALPRWTRPVQTAGRHSLLVYLVHQPVLIGLIWLFSLVFPAAQTPPDIAFTRACTAQCEEMRGPLFCAAYCTCVLEGLDSENRLDEIHGGSPSPETSQRLQEIVQACSFETEFAVPEEEP
ncbi:heparan-alpha-glucosaminide N-acetyltransferase [Neoaquamicrobium microcysteis]|nr:DUF1624 domain-containing protein [Mesorhizobium microcysteis]